MIQPTVGMNAAVSANMKPTVPTARATLGRLSARPLAVSPVRNQNSASPGENEEGQPGVEEDLVEEQLVARGRRHQTRQPEEREEPAAREEAARAAARGAAPAVSRPNLRHSPPSTTGMA